MSCNGRVAFGVGLVAVVAAQVAIPGAERDQRAAVAAAVLDNDESPDAEARRGRAFTFRVPVSSFGVCRTPMGRLCPSLRASF